MEGTGTITSLNGDRARVKVTPGAECAGCAAKSHCHGAAPRQREITVINSYGAEVGDHVIFEAHPSRVAISAVLVWIVPILAMIVGYVIADRLAGGFIPILMAFLFLALAFGALRTVDNAISGGTSFYPAVTGMASSEPPPGKECPEYPKKDA